MSDAPIRYRPGQEIPGANYRALRELGEGGHAIVYLGEHKVLTEHNGAPRRGAIKVLHDTFSHLPDLARRMRAEANILAQLKHHHLVTLIDAGTTTDASPRPFTVMEYLRGEPLSYTIAAEANGVPLEWALQITCEVLEALAVAHNRNVIHRDIKPANIFLCRHNDTNITKLLDFGVACLLDVARVTGKNFLGTPRYAAPEILAGQSPSAQSDLYAVGLVLYELLCGRGPFDSIQAAAGVPAYLTHVRHHLTCIPPRPSTRRHDLPPELDDLVVQLLEKDPEKRPKTAASLLATLRRIARRHHEHPTATTPDPNRTEPTPLDNRLITFSAPTDPIPSSLAEGPQDTPHDPNPMGNLRTLRMTAEESADTSDLRALLPPSERSVPHAPATRTIRMETAPARPTSMEEPSPSSSHRPVLFAPPSPTTLPGPPPVRESLRMSPRIYVDPEMPRRTGTEDSARTDQGRRPQIAAVERFSSLEEVGPGPIHTHPRGGRIDKPTLPDPLVLRADTRSTDKPTLAFDRGDLAQLHELARLDAELEKRQRPPPATDPSAAPGLVLQTRLRRAAHSRTWQIAAAAVVLLLAAVTLWAARPSRFTPQPPPPWLTAQAAQPLPPAPTPFPPAPSASATPPPQPPAPDPSTPPAASAAPSSPPAPHAPLRPALPRRSPAPTQPLPMPGGDFQPWHVAPGF